MLRRGYIHYLANQYPGYAQVMQALGPLLWYKYNELSGTTQTNYGTLANADAMWGPGSGAAQNQTEIQTPGEAYKLPGRTQIANNAAFAAAHEWTLLLLARPTTANNLYLWCYGQANGDSNHFITLANATANLTARVYNSAGTNFASVGDLSLTLDRWTLLFFTFSNSGDRKVHIYYMTPHGILEMPCATQQAMTGTYFDTSAAMNIGALGNNTFGVSGYLGEAAFFDRVLTTSQMAQIGNSRQAYQFGSQNLIFDGDSLTQGLFSSNPYPQQMIANYPNAAYYTAGISGQRLGTMATSGRAAHTDPQTIPGARNILVAWAGTNDIFVDLQSAATVLSRAASYCSGALATGYYYKILFLDMLPRQDTGGAQQETDRVTFNSSLASTLSGLATVVSVSADPNLQDPTNTTYFGGDKAHLIAAGDTEVVNTVKPFIDAALAA